MDLKECSSVLGVVWIVVPRERVQKISRSTSGEKLDLRSVTERLDLV